MLVGHSGVLLAALLGTWWTWVALFCATDTFAGERWLAVLALPIVLFSAWATAAAARRRRALLGAVLLASPVVVLPIREIARAAQSYLDGTARLIRVGLPAAIPPFRLDPDSRIPLYFSGCVTTDLWDARVQFNNETIRWASDTFGPMPGLYTGPIPSDEAMAAAIARHGVELSAAYDGTRLSIAGADFALPHLLRITLDMMLVDDLGLRAVVLYDRLLVVQEADMRSTLVFDRSTGRQLDGALYEPLAEAHPELAPRWQREMME
jgi:hypothetical protein